MISMSNKSRVLKILPSKSWLFYVSTLMLLCCCHRVIPNQNVSSGSKPGAFGKHHFHLTSASNNNNDKDGIKDSSSKSAGDSPMGCKELRSKRYISDGPCTSIKPITEVVCAGICLPISKLPWYSDYVNLWSRHAAGEEREEWHCVEDVTKRKRVNLLCQDGQQRSYVIKAVRSCKCKKRKHLNNKTVNSKRKL